MTYRSSRVAVGLAALLACSCTDDGLRLSVDVRTDFVPGAEFYYVDTALETLDGQPVSAAMFNAHRGVDALEGFRAADLAGFAPGSYVLWVRLRDGAYGAVVDRRVDLDLSADFSVTVVAGRSCAGVMCDAGQTCLDGACVDPTCTPQTPEACPAPACASDSDCPAPAASCATGRCLDGSCFAAPDPTMMCGPTAFCRPETGCEPYPSLSDAGAPMDAGPGDAGPGDAGPFDSGTTLPGPDPLAPLPGASTGDLSVVVNDGTVPDPSRPKLKWAFVAGATGYRVELARDSTFGSVLRTFETTSQYYIPQPGGAEPLDVAGDWFMRVRSCTGASGSFVCGVPGPTRRFVVGRAEVDFDNDGLRDAVFGAPAAVGGAGAVFAGLGVASGEVGPLVLLGNPLLASGGMGRAVAVGDFLGGLEHEIAAGAPFEDLGGGTHSGAVYLFQRSMGGTWSEVTTTRLVPSTGTAGGRFGEALISPGDLDGNGYDDLVVGQPGEAFANEGIINVYLAQDGGGFAGVSPIDLGAPGTPEMGSKLGFALAAPGDLNHDGFPDLLVGEPEHSSGGRVYVLFGGPSVTTNQLVPLADPPGLTGGDGFGGSIAGIDDVNADGYPDVLIGASGAGSSGAAHVYLGTGDFPYVPLYDQTITIPAAAAGAEVGWAVAGLGDINGDFTPDFAIAAPADDSSNGRVYVYQTPAVWTDGLAAPQLLSGSAGGHRFGSRVCGRGGRLRQPGVIRLLATEPGADGSFADGAAYLFEWGGGSLSQQGPPLLGGSATGLGWSCR